MTGASCIIFVCPVINRQEKSHFHSISQVHFLFRNKGRAKGPQKARRPSRACKGQTLLFYSSSLLFHVMPYIRQQARVMQLSRPKVPQTVRNGILQSTLIALHGGCGLKGRKAFFEADVILGYFQHPTNSWARIFGPRAKCGPLQLVSEPLSGAFMRPSETENGFIYFPLWELHGIFLAT